MSHLSYCVGLCVHLSLQEAGLSLSRLGGGKVNTRQQRGHLGVVREGTGGGSSVRDWGMKCEGLGDEV